jgi:anaerobic selenocysteine-containing dehydrogenase
MMAGVTTERRSFCRICLAVCGVVATVDGDQVVAIRGDPDDPLSQGYVCPKGRGLADLHHRNRLDGTFVRREGELRPVSLDEGLDDVAGRLREVLERYGPSAIATFSGSGGFSDPIGSWAVGTLKAKLGVTQSYSTSTVDAVSPHTTHALEMAGAPAFIPHPDRAPRLLLHVGSNPVVSHGQSTRSPTRRAHPSWGERSVWVSTLGVRRPPRCRPSPLGTSRHDYALLAYVLRAPERRHRRPRWCRTCRGRR